MKNLLLLLIPIFCFCSFSIPQDDFSLKVNILTYGLAKSSSSVSENFTVRSGLLLYKYHKTSSSIAGNRDSEKEIEIGEEELAQLKEHLQYQFELENKEVAVGEGESSWRKTIIVSANLNGEVLTWKMHGYQEMVEVHPSYNKAADLIEMLREKLEIEPMVQTRY